MIMIKSFISFLSAGLLALTVSAASSVWADEAKRENPVVVELFTSLVCANCPPAEKLVVEMHDDPDVLVLTYHIDYLDMGPIKDPHAERRWSHRQREYQQRFDKAYVYTPQLVVDGQVPVEGLNQAALKRAFATAMAKRDKQFYFRHHADGRVRLICSPGQEPDLAALKLLDIHFDRLLTVDVRNSRGKKHERMNAHSVRELVKHELALNDGILDMAWRDQDFKAQGRAFMIQNQVTGEILGSFWGYR